jgi:histidinol-phosphate aminotransferase
VTGYARPRAGLGGLRLHLNEHTGGCSPRVLAHLRALDATAAGFYPDYEAALDAAAKWFGVADEQIVLTNGLDEGLLAASIVALRRTGGEAIVLEPAFDMYEICVRALAGDVVRVRLEDDGSVNPERVLAAVTPRTRIVFVNDPHNPTGGRVPYESIDRLAAALPGVLVFVDEAYADFAGESYIPRALESRNVVVGRTFAKAYGLAGLRLGAVIGRADLIRELIGVIPPYSINAYAAAALVAALDDPGYIADYIAEAAESRTLIYAACQELGLGSWPSAANFVLIRVGPRAAAVAVELARRGIYIRDRSGEPGCAGCIRLTAGRVDDTRRVVEALREILCGAR